jgi:uncharacterized coiled-coil protein SlyX
MGEHLSSVIERAGGYTKDAYLFGAMFTRISAKNAQMASMQKMITNLESAVAEKERDLTALSPDVLAERQSDLARNREMLARIKIQAPEGRVVIKLDDPEKMKGSNNDLMLDDGDKIIIPPIPKIINVIGEVYSPSSLVFYQDDKVSDYVNKLGGFTRNADQDSVYVLKANGLVLSKDQGAGMMSMKLDPGDSIVIPQKIERTDFFAGVRDFTKWFYEVAVAYAVVHTALK